jgi:hypothetical protein
MPYCQMCGKGPGDNWKGLRIPYIAQQGRAPLPTESESDGLGRGTGQRWDAIMICMACAKKLGETIAAMNG